MASERYLKNKERYNAASRRWYLNNKGKHSLIQKKSTLKRLYGITLEEYESLLTFQNNKCAICGIDKSETKTFHVDHDHKTGKNRKLLCPKCNVLIGMANDNTEILRSAINYIEIHKEVNEN